MANGWGSSSSSSSRTQNTTSSGSNGWGGSSSTSSPSTSSGGGGGLLHGLKSFFGGAGHYIAHQASEAGHLIKATPGGLIHQANVGVIQPWWATLHGQNAFDPNSPQQKAIGKEIDAQLAGIEHTISHPGENLLATALLAAPALHGVGRAGVAGVEAGQALRAGEGVGGALRAAQHSKILNSPRTLTPPGGEPVTLAASRNTLRRAYQAAHDAYVQRALNTKPESRVAQYGASRMHGTLSEVARSRVRMRQAVTSSLRKASQPVSGEIAKAAKSAGLRLENSPKTIGQAAIELVSHNTTPEEAIIRAEAAIERGVNPELNQANIGLYREVQQLGLVDTLGREVGINPGFKSLARAESILHEGAARLDTEIAQRNLRPESQLVRRRNLPAAVTQRLRPYEEPKLSPALSRAYQDFERVDRAYQKALDQESRWRQGEGPKNAKGPNFSPGGNRTSGGLPEQSNPYRNRVVRLGIRHEEVLQRLQKLEAKHGVAKTAVPEDLRARSELIKFAGSKFGKDVAKERVALLDRRAAQFARENDMSAAEFYRRYLKELKTPQTIAHVPEEIAPLYETAPALPREELSQVDPKDISKSVLERSDVKLPKGWTNVDIEAAVNRLMPYVEEGAPYRDWYARGAKVIKDAARRLGVGVREMLGTVAVTSQGANPTFNLRLAAKAVREFKDTGRVTKEPHAPMVEAQMKLTGSKKPAKGYSGYLHKPSEAQAALEGRPPETIKRTSYYANFLHELDKKAFAREYGHRLDPVTVDRHMVRMIFDTTKASPSEAEYSVAEAIMQEIAKRLGWRAKEVQAAAWVPWKARNEMQSALARATKAGRGEAFDQSLERFIPNAADAYEAGHAENIGVLYQVAREEPPAELQTAATAAREPDGGFTLNRDFTPDVGKDGFAVALAPYEARIPADRISAEDIATYAAQHAKLLEADDSLRIGGWHNPEDGLVYLDLSRIVPSREEAMALARQEGQLSVFDRAAAARGDWDNAFPGSGLSAEQADAIKAAARGHAPPELTFQHVEQPGFRRVIATRNGEHAGQITYGPIEGGRHQVQMIRVPENLRRQGIGTALFNEAERTVGKGNLLHQDNPDLLSPEGEAFSRSFERPSLESQSNGVVRGSYEPETATMSFARQHAIPETVTHEALHAIRQSLPELLQRKFERRYGIGRGEQWSRASEEQFVEDMLGVHNGTVTDPELTRIYHQLTDFVPGRSFTPLTTLERNAPGAPMASSQGPVVGLATDPLNSNFTTGKGLLSGQHQADVIDSVARHWHNVFRFFNTQDWRDLITKTGSDTRRSSRDILVRVDNRTEGGVMHPKAVGKVTDEIEQMLGRKRSTAYTPEMEGEDAGILASLQQFTDHLFPGRVAGSEEAQLEATAVEGAPAPKGYKWVDQKVAGNLDIARPGKPTVVGRFFDNVNAAVTAATVYFKIGHFGTRYLTNAATNIMQGSANPYAIKTAVETWRELTPQERLDALASAGTHYYEALPGAEGQSVISRAVQHGLTRGSHFMSPQWWAGYVDAPFRFNSLAYEVRKSPYGGAVEGMRRYLADLKNYNSLEPHERAEVDGIVRRANREAIAYDRLGQTEKTYLSRAVWFYPWIKGSTVWTASALFEHPFKSGYLANAGVVGEQLQKQEIGDVPSYSFGVFMLAHGEPFPLVADFSTFNPEATAGDVLQIPEHADELAGLLNPGLAAVQQIATSTNQYGEHTNTPIPDAARNLIASTPEAQILEAYLGRNGDQSHREYPAVPGDPFSKTWLGMIIRGLIGPGTPRRINPEAAHSLAERERTGR